MHKRILVIGYGEMGHAMSHLLQPNHDVTIWQRHPETGKPLPLSDVARDKDFVFFCVPTEPVYTIAQEIKPSLSKDTICLSIGKGVDNSGRPAFRAMTDALGEQSPHAVIYGPMIAEELSADRPGFAQVGSTNKDWSQRTKQLFDGTRLYLSTSNDTVGLSWCAVLKNVYAIAFGVADGLGLGDNVRGYLAATALSELADAAVELGGSARAPYGLAGLGDLLTTATSPDSHHHGIGMKLARGDRSNIAGEGVHTMTTVKNLGIVDISRYPLFALVAQIVEQDVDIEAVWEDYLATVFAPQQS
jgi:glycerol-3-phosphate dehydrogenase (NAD(P)+)